MRLGKSSLPQVGALLTLVLLTGACATVGATVSFGDGSGTVGGPGDSGGMALAVERPRVELDARPSLTAPAVPAAPTTAAPATTAKATPLLVSFDPAPGAVGVRPDARVAAAVRGGQLISVQVSTADGPVPGRVRDGQFTPAQYALDVDRVYTIAATVRSDTGVVTTHRSAFATLEPAETISADITPEEGDVVGIGRPVIVRFSDPVDPEDRAAVQARFHVDSSPKVAGAWRWMSDSAMHWRPLEYWPAGTTVWVAAATNGLAVGERWFAGGSGLRKFHIGDAHRITIDAATHQMVVYENGVPIRQIPISAGSDRYPTASGIDLIMEKHDRFEMDSTSVGIYGAEAYRLTVDDAQRITNSGTFIHAAPWNGSLGEANLSHGCINASNEDAQWLMDFTLIGDPVEIVNTPEQVSPTNGWGDWNIPAEEWAQPVG